MYNLPTDTNTLNALTVLAKDPRIMGAAASVKVELQRALRTATGLHFIAHASQQAESLDAEAVAAQLNQMAAACTQLADGLVEDSRAERARVLKAKEEAADLLSQATQLVVGEIPAEINRLQIELRNRVAEAAGKRAELKKQGYSTDKIDLIVKPMPQAEVDAVDERVAALKVEQAALMAFTRGAPYFDRGC